VIVEVNSVRTGLIAGTYRLPETVGGVQVDCAVTRGYTSNGIDNVWNLKSDARIRLWPADSPWIRPGTFTYPANQRWFASDTQMANDPCYVDGGEVPDSQPSYIYHYGLDIGGAEGMVEVVAATDGLVVVAGETWLDPDTHTPARPRYDVVYILDARGWYYRYSHLQSIDPAVRIGERVKMGQTLGVLGKEGGSGGWSHLHFDITGRQPDGEYGIIEGYAFLWQSYHTQRKTQLQAVARPHYFLWTSQPVTLDGTRSWSAGDTDGIRSYQWLLHDGTSAQAAAHTLRYEKSGTYSEVLKITDGAGRIDYDFAVVQVIDKDHPDRLPPSIHATYAPTEQITVEDDITFKVRSFRIGPNEGHETWSFGDGSQQVTVQSDGNAQKHDPNGYAVTTHRFNKPGHYLVTVQRVNDYGQSATTHLHVRVAPRTSSARDLVDKLSAIVEVEEDVYTYEPADNGAGPMWCYGNTSIVRVKNEVFASGIEVISGAKPYNNCVPFLLRRTENGWDRVFQDNGRTREPCPLVMFHGGQVFLSTNPTLTPPDAQSGPARPGIFEFRAASLSEAPNPISPVWEGEPVFTEHSYRSFAADGEKGEMILLQNIGYTHAEWSFRDSDGKWSAQGKLAWPWGAGYDRPQPIRVCYPAVALKDRRGYFCGVSDIVEPNQAWRDYKLELTGRKWDYDFRRLYYTWSDDITTGEFGEWIEISSREKTAGKIRPCDLYVAANGDVFVLWTESALDERLREEFFPDAKQRYSLECAILRDGKMVRCVTLAEGGEGLSGVRPGRGRFHVTEDKRLVVLYYQRGTHESSRYVSENRIVEVDLKGNLSAPISVKLEQPFTSFFTATIRAGCKPSDVLDVYGSEGTTMRYARIRIR
jgi:hypothetical protein